MKKFFVLIMMGIFLLSALGCGSSPASNQPTQPETWHEVAEFNGNGPKSTESFTIPSDEWRVSYQSKQQKSNFKGLLQVDVHKKSGDLTNGVANVMGDSSGNSIVRGKGEYYLDVNSFGVNYTLVVEAKY